MTDANNKIMEEILSLLKNKYKQIDNIMTLTKEMEKALDANDHESLGAVLTMRQEVMDKVDELSAGVAKNMGGMDPEYREKVKGLLSYAGESGKFEGQIDGPLERGVFDTNQMILRLLKRIVEYDKKVNAKVKKEG